MCGSQAEGFLFTSKDENENFFYIGNATNGMHFRTDELSTSSDCPGLIVDCFCAFDI